MEFQTKLRVQPDAAIVKHNFLLAVDYHFPAVEENRLAVLHLLQQLLNVIVPGGALPSPVQRYAQVVAGPQRQDCHCWVFYAPRVYG